MRRINTARLLVKLTKLFPKRYPIFSSPKLKNQPFFVFGSGRNGSTLLNLILNNHPELYLPSEQYFLGNSIFKFRLYNYMLWRDLVKIIGAELYPKIPTQTWNYDPSAAMQELYHSKNRSLQHIIDEFYRTYGSQMKSFAKWGDTTPLNTYYLPEIYEVFPKASYIFLLRNGLDVIGSYKKGGSEAFDQLSIPVNAARHWVHSIDKFKWLSKRTNVHLIKYEDLVRAPEKELTRLCVFLKIEFHKEVLKPVKIPKLEIYQEKQHQNLSEPVTQSYVGNWRNILSPEEISITARIIKSSLVQMGYEFQAD